MKHTFLLAATAAAALIAGGASAQVAESFDNLVDEVLAESDATAAFFSGAVNTADINGSVDITAGASELGGTSSSALDMITRNTSTDEASSIAADGSTTASYNTTEGYTELHTDTSSMTESVTQNFGQVSTMAAGAVNDASFDLEETGAIVNASASASTTRTSVASDVASTTGMDIGVVSTAFNTGYIDGSVTLNAANANIGFGFAAGGGDDSFTGVGGINTMAAGAVSSSDIAATFTGGAGRDVDAFADVR